MLIIERNLSWPPVSHMCIFTCYSGPEGFSGFGMLIIFCKYAPPMVTSCTSSKRSWQNRSAIEDLPTAESPSRMILASIIPPGLLALRVPVPLAPVVFAPAPWLPPTILTPLARELSAGTLLAEPPPQQLPPFFFCAASTDADYRDDIISIYN